MSNGVETLLQAALYLEQQDRLKSSNEQHRLLPHHAYDASSNDIITQSGNNNININNNNNNNHTNNNNINISTRSSNGRPHQYHISSSAPAAGATFQHTNGLTITATSNIGSVNGSGSGSGSGSGINTSGGSQLIKGTNNHHRRGNNDFELIGNGNIGTGVTIVTTTTPLSASSPSSSSSPIAAVITSSNGRSSEGRMSEDEFSSPVPTPNSSTLCPQSKSPAFFLLASSNSSNEQQHQEQKQHHEQQLQFEHEQQQKLQLQLQQQQQLLQQQQQHNENNQKLKSFTLANHNYPISNVAGGGVVAKQMLLNGGIRVATNNNIINIPHQQQHQQNIASKLLATSSPSPSTFSLHGSMPRYKAGLPLTPPPNATRKHSEPYSRIRSFSLSSHKISANLLQNSGSSGNSSNSSNHMIVDDAPHLGGGSNHSPPRHYMQMMSSAQHQGSQGSLHHMTPLGGSGRRRTISSNSNGAGTREVHNKLEKNRRAHLKGCYDELKGVLQLKDEERSKKTSNLAVLNEALTTVKVVQEQQKKDETVIEKLAKDKITLNKRFMNLKRDLGPKYEILFSPIFPDGELSIPSERDNVHDSVSLSSGRGSALYSSSSSLSSGGSSNIMVSPVGAGQLHTATPTAISPVITKINNNNNSNSTTVSTTNITNINNHINSMSTVSLTDSPNGLPLALAATTITRGSPTPSTPSPSPSASSGVSSSSSSSSSGVSSSSSLISSSPPMNGVISSGRSVTVNIPFQTNSNGATIGTIGNGTASAAATIIATSPPTGNSSRANNAQTTTINVTNHPTATTITTSIINNQTHNGNNINNNGSNSNSNGSMSNGYRRKTSLSIGDDAKATTGNINDYEDVAQQPAAKFIKVYNSLVTTENSNIGNITKHTITTSPSSLSAATLSKNVATGSLQLSQVVGGGSLVVSPTFINAVTAGSTGTIRTQKILVNGQNSTKSIVLNGNATSNELGRLPGGAELNILPSNSTSIANCGNGGMKLNSPAIGAAMTTPTTAFYNANGKLTLVNGGAAVGVGVGVSGNNGILLKEGSNLIGGTTAALTPIIVSTSTATSNINNGSGIHNNTSSNFAQLLAATSMAASGQAQSLAAVKTATSIERLNGKLSLSVGGQALPRINAQYIGAIKPAMNVTAVSTSIEHAPTTIKTMKSNNNILKSGTAFLAAKKLKTNST